MKNMITAIMIWLGLFTACGAQTDITPSAAVLDRCLQFSDATDPGEYATLYKNLPESVEEICALIKKQLIHPFDLDGFAGQVPESRAYEDREIPNVSGMLKVLFKRNPDGLVYSRKPEERLVLACVHHSLLLASICRYRGIPVRLRAGFANYIGGRRDIHVTHAICEIWDKRENRWLLVDPDRQRYDLPRDDFQTAAESWSLLRKRRLSKNRIVSRYKTVDQAVVHILWSDLSYVTIEEAPYWMDPPLVNKVRAGLRDLSSEELSRLDKLADLLDDPDRHLEELELALDMFGRQEKQF